MNILVIGSGSREHSIILALKHEATKNNIICTPGNAGIATDVECIEGDILNANEMLKIALEHKTELVIVGPEAPLSAGVADKIREAGIAVFGPDKRAAAIESSKTFAKEIMQAAKVPTGGASTATTLEEAINALEQYGAPYVVKADGLAAGKGVLVTENIEEATEHVQTWISHGPVLIEEYLTGPEVSLFVISDGEDVMPLSPAQDFKRAYDGDTGPNTGGMGAYSPLNWLPEDFVSDVVADVARPVIKELANRGTPFVGLLYCGLIITPEGVKVIEFNARFGDPETQVVLPRLETPLSGLLYAAATHNLNSHPNPIFSNECAVAVVLASENYPGNPVIGLTIERLEEAAEIPNVHIAHAATRKINNELIATGGRVLSVVALANSLNEARGKAYQAINQISLSGSHFRTDIAAWAAADSLDN